MMKLPQVFILPDAAIAGFHQGVEAVGEKANRDDTQQEGAERLMGQVLERSIQTCRFAGVVLDSRYDQEDADDTQDNAQGGVPEPAEANDGFPQLKRHGRQIES